ncbi:hypothetical protein ACHQM5_018761 [Ranunculus cassubicifolius]
MADLNPPNTSLEPWKTLNGKVVLITGSSSGIGRDLCLDLAKAGCKIVAAARRIDRLTSLCTEINNSENGEVRIRAIPVALDVSAKGEEICESVHKAWDAFGWIDALVNNAGIRGAVRSPLEISEEEWDDNIHTNLTGTWLVSKYVCKFMSKEGRKGSVINVSSIGGLSRGHLPGGIAYNASKTAVNAITKVMALELGPYNIRVNSISPGLFKSEITEGLMQRTWLNNIALRTVPLKTFGTSNPALTSLVRYLIHDLSEYVSGNLFIVDAGATLPGSPLFSSL